ncbi:PIG-L family deacetylase [Clostridium botulinum]|uniref:LmbE family protein n=1 Tax=Clostridium botulinum (strain Okra / Type B1) TaxID=498213 RepID=B1IK50_CLOBK|nr:PIG-L family deacetylase [Clostridium botulinum]ACA46590.1 LmbE family protein [Clostridium botulinum B1 str. Okra]MBD5562195.1 PIG-L family deacetylase [Clostridium botulinum]MBD5567150.1 PIG-L family deacetylase [Clostridium botulinum]MBD5570237.1 PIG-L family deacetylase [Clostridium botulinum]MBD5574049.1 PIG-L family deacetylase [Clostridium botulinum]
MKVLVIAVHPDDETLGCGGTILKHVDNNDEVHWLILTDVLEEYGYSKEHINREYKIVESVKDAYGFKDVMNVGFPAGNIHLISFEKIIDGISEFINKIKPEIIYMPNRSDIHTDHQIAVKAIWSCTKAFRYPFIKKILMYECVSETDAAPALPENVFIPNVFSDITEYIDKKIEILKLYDSEIGLPPFPRSIDNIMALARYRGSSVSRQFAEAFMLVRDIC